MDNGSEEKNVITEEKNDKEEKKFSDTLLRWAYELVEMLGTVTVVIMLIFAFVVRLNVVEGQSMEQTLHQNEYLVVADPLFTYKPARGDIVVVHKIDAVYPKDGAATEAYTDPIVKRVIATEGQTVDIDFDNWVLTVDGEIVEESYRYLDPMYMTLRAQYDFPITVEEGKVFVMGDNRNHSADSRRLAIGQVDVRCIVGKAIMRVFPFDRITFFTNPYSN